VSGCQDQRVRFVYVALAGACGSLARYGIALAVGPRSFPWATFAVNVSGSFALGVVLTVAVAKGWSNEAVAAVAVGFLGAYTTFSTFSFETFSLAHTGRSLTAGAYVAASVALGIAAARAGYALGQVFVR
jgi:CrcB protein